MNPESASNAVLEAFHPAVRAWFETELGSPTPPQREAWPAIMAGRDTLVAAPTGSGKTLAAFLVAINRLVEEGLQPGKYLAQTSVLYVSPLKALGNDIRRNLELPLAGIAATLREAGLPEPDIRVAVRSGDTPQQERQHMLRKPPHILVTTPESLYLLLTSKGGRRLLSGVRSVIVDEIHAMLGDKRGSHLSLSLERLQNLVPWRLQRIGLSATQKPIERVAAYLCGNRHKDCVIVDGGHRRRLQLSLEVPRSPLSALMSNEVWEELYERLVELIATHRTTLVFVNTRRLAERLALALADRIGPEHVSSHHGSMSKEHRFDAEQRLKQGELRVLVATASMELGIDVGAVELVVQFSSPKRIAAFLQRVGRSCHQVGGLPKGVLFPLTRDDLVECAALLDAVRRGELDEVLVPDKPLDILAQHLVAELASLEDECGDVAIEDLWQWVRRSWVYRELQREEFDAVLQMLAEGYSTRRGRSGVFIHLDRINGRARARRGARLMALTNGGAIPDMFDYQVVLDPEDIVVGSLNEDFALETLPGDVFSLGTHSWRLLRVDGLKVRVADAQGQAATVPFWLGEGPGRSRELSEAVSRLREELQTCFANSLQKGQEWLERELGLVPAAAAQLADYLYTGSRALGVMPTREVLVMERFFDEVGDMHVVIHSPFGSRLNRAWGLALRKRFCRSFNFELQAAANEDSIVISLGAVHSFELEDVFHYLSPHNVREVLVQALLDAPMFEVRWRWNATRALAVQRNRNGQRVPPQFQRMAAEDFVAQVFPDQLACLENISGPREVPTHPLVQQTIHDCLTEAMDVEELEALMRRIAAAELELVARDLREPSPFAQEIINARPYAFLDDAPFEERRTRAIRHRSWVDPAEAGDFSALDQGAIDRVREEAWPAIRNADELHEALYLLGFMTDAEVHGSDSQPDVSIHLEPLLKAGRVSCASRGRQRLWIAAERQPLFAALGGWTFRPAVQLPESLRVEPWDATTALREVLRGRLEALGPVSAAALAASLGMEEREVLAALLQLEAEGFAFQGHYSPQGTEGGKEWCERRLLQRIHRHTIDAHRESIKPVSLQVYMQHLFEQHGIRPADGSAAPAPGGPEVLARVLSQLDGCTVPAQAWESEILPARLGRYDPAWLDQLCVRGQVCWGRILRQREEHSGRRSGPVRSSPMNLVRRDNLDLWQALAGSGGDEQRAGLSSAALLLLDLLRQRGASFHADLVRHSGLLALQVEEALAELVSAGLVTADNFSGLRALLLPAARRSRSRPHGRRPLFGIEDAGRWALLDASDSGPIPLDESRLDRLLLVYLQRWGVLCRKVMEREGTAPPWRVLLPRLRRMELRGEVRGGHFIAGVGGEQFALAGTVDALRARQRQWQQERDSGAARRPQRVVINATDPLNLLGILLPERRVAQLAGNRILFEDGLPVAVLEREELFCLGTAAGSLAQEYRQLLGRQPGALRPQASISSF